MLWEKWGERDPAASSIPYTNAVYTGECGLGGMASVLEGSTSLLFRGLGTRAQQPSSMLAWEGPLRSLGGNTWAFGSGQAEASIKLPFLGYLLCAGA